MSSTVRTSEPIMLSSGFMSRNRIVAKPGYNRWMLPPCALAIHLCIGMAYGFSVFWLPLTHALGGGAAACAPSVSVWQALTTTSCEWRVSDLIVMYELFFVFLGSAAALFGGWLERAGPRKAGLVATACWCGGLLISALGVKSHQLWMLWVGSGALGGVGLGLGYISPVSTLIKWFPDRRGMATGMAIMGFGGGALVGAPLANLLLGDFSSPGDVGVWQTFTVMAVVYAVFMSAGALGYRVPPENWRPDGFVPATTARKLISSHNVALQNAHRTPQFWLIWAVLCLNVTAGIGVISVASPMLQEIFGGSLIGQAGVRFAALSADQKIAVAAVAAGFTGLISLFNIGGRFFWASFSDRIGRKTTYATFFVLGIVLYAAAPGLARSGQQALFVAAICVILSMYGGGFATVPAYLADMFGTKFVGAIHGRLLTAWSVAGVAGPFLISSLRDFELSAGVPRESVYDVTLYILAGLLAVGFLANLAIRPVASRWWMPADTASVTGTAVSDGGSFGIGRGGLSAPALLAWACVAIPILWGVWLTLKQALILFG
jgi:MFS family permease